MSRLFFIALLSTLSFFAHSQSYKDDVKKQFLEYANLLVKKDFAGSVEYLNPAFLTIVPKAQLVKVLEQTYNNPNIDFEIEQANVVSVEDKKKIADQDYVKLRYSNYLKMHFKSPEGKRVDTAAVKTRLETQFGQGNVSYDPKTDFFRILVFKNVVANSADNKKWTFVVVEDKQKPILEKILPKELL